MIVGLDGDDGIVEWSNNGCLADDERGDKAGGVVRADLGLLKSISSGSDESPRALRVGDAVGESTTAEPDGGGGVDGREPWTRA